MQTLSSPSLIIIFLGYSLTSQRLTWSVSFSIHANNTIDFYQSFSFPAWNTLYSALNLLALNNKNKNKTQRYSLLFLKKIIALKNISFRFRGKLSRKYREFPYNFCLHTCIASPIINILHQSGTFLKINKPTLIFHKHPQILSLY